MLHFQPSRCSASHPSHGKEDTALQQLPRAGEGQILKRSSPCQHKVYKTSALTPSHSPLCITWVPLSRAHAGVHTHCSACTLHMPSPPFQPSGPCAAWQARGPGRHAQWVELSWQGLGECELSSNGADSGASPEPGVHMRWVAVTPRGPAPTARKKALGSSQGHWGTRGQGKSSHSHCSPCIPRVRPWELPASPSATKQPRCALPERERNQVSNVYKPIWRGWDAAQASAQKKCTFYGINILVCLLLSSPQAPAQKPQQQPSSQPFWQLAPSDPHSNQCLLQQKPTQTHLAGAETPNPACDPPTACKGPHASQALP